jgi:hypothetical protein
MEARIADRLRPWFPDEDLTRVRLIHSGPVSWFVRTILRQGAMTIAPFIFFGRDRFDENRPASLALLAHEVKHIQQYRELGHIQFLWTYLRDRRRAGGYSRELPLEVQPYALQAVVQDALESQARGGP